MIDEMCKKAKDYVFTYMDEDGRLTMPKEDIIWAGELMNGKDFGKAITRIIEDLYNDW